MIRLGIMSSTRGTHLSTIAHAIQTSQLSASIAIVLSNKMDGGILNRAMALGLPTQFVNPQGLTRETYDQQISRILSEHKVDLIVLVGYMRILSKEFIATWKNKIINVHPSLLPAFAGKMDLDVHQAVLAAQAKETGCTVHYVTDVVDSGPILLQKKCVVFADDTPESLKQRVQALEGQALIECIQQWAK